MYPSSKLSRVAIGRGDVVDGDNMLLTEPLFQNEHVFLARDC